MFTSYTKYKCPTCCIYSYIMFVSPIVISLLFEALPRHFRQKSVDAVMPIAVHRPDFQLGRDRWHQDLPWLNLQATEPFLKAYRECEAMVTNASLLSTILFWFISTYFYLCCLYMWELYGSLWCKLRPQKSSQICAAMQVSRVAKATSQVFALKPPPMTQGGPTAGSH